jgi:vacuolar protein sorting-associated protein 51
LCSPHSRLESLLDSFYGLEDEETAAQNARDIDSSAFDVAASASEVIAKRSLPDLISYANNLETDTKSLDRQMQDLVYNNYSKFIGATDTIRRMKDR